MQTTTRTVQEKPGPKSLDVICAGEALWKVAPLGSPLPRTSARVRYRPGGGVVNVALALARTGLRVGLVTVLGDDTFGRGSLEKIAAAGVDVGGIVLARPRAGLVVVDATGGASHLVSAHHDEPALEVPLEWSSQVLFLSGLSPLVSHAAALCKAARRARRAGTLVLLDFNAGLHAWHGRDPRTIRMVLREVDAVRCSMADLAVLGMDVTLVRAALRQSAVLVVSDGAGPTVATGPFGEVALVPRERAALPAKGAGDAFAAAICGELARPGGPGESPSSRWHRALRRGHAAATALPDERL